MAKPKIYPFYLNDYIARHLIEKHAFSELNESIRYHSEYVELRHSAEVLENGDVEVYVTYRDDCGMILSSGCCLKKVIRPFSEEKLLELKQERMFALAEEEFYRRQREKELKAIAKLQKEMFGE